MKLASMTFPYNSGLSDEFSEILMGPKILSQEKILTLKGIRTGDER